MLNLINVGIIALLLLLITIISISIVILSTCVPMFRSHLSCVRGGAAGRLRRRAQFDGGSHNMGTINCVSFLL